MLNVTVLKFKGVRNDARIQEQFVRPDLNNKNSKLASLPAVA